jgi:hypothetical protein
MQDIQYSTGSASPRDSEGKDSIARESSELQKDLRIIVANANKKVRLYSVLKNYNIKLPQNYKSQTWSTPIICPFPSHKGGKERTASWGYNFVEDRFNCLGCKKSGRAVEFISEMESKNKLVVAKTILESYGGYDLDHEIIFDDSKIDSLLFESAALIRSAIKSANPEKLKHIHKLSWWFDAFISNKLNSSFNNRNIGVEEMIERFNTLKRLLKEISSEDTDIR